MEIQRDKVILVNDRDECIGVADKLAVHRTGALHRAVSVFITNSSGELLLQQRAAGKYHSGGLWSNACCSHPSPGELTRKAAERRLREEMGIDTELSLLTRLIYRANLGDGLVEHEYDHLFTASWGEEVKPDVEEVSDHRWVLLRQLDQWMQDEPQVFTAWFPILLKAWRELVLSAENLTNARSLT